MALMALDTTIPARIVELIQVQDWPVGSHLPAQRLADLLRVSRSPINEALQLLHEKGVVQREPNRGYFVARRMAGPGHQTLKSLGLDGAAGSDDLYFRIAEDRLRGALPDDFTEALLRKTYGATQGEIDAVLGRIAGEGWAEKRPGYGWAFSPMLTTPDSLLQSYRMRLALEPAALLEPGYRLAQPVIERLRAAERHLLDGGIETDTALQLHDRGVRFHEALVEGSGNAFFIDTIRRVNRVRRLLSYRSMQDRKRYKEHARQHLNLLQLLEKQRNEEAAEAMRGHLESTLRNITKIKGLLKA
jgi:DNA-binding GntR family transcriptional regulator